MSTILASSRRTVMDGEVVTFATAFRYRECVLGPSWDAAGPFEVSASRDSVIVHRADCRRAEAVADLAAALIHASRAMERLRGRYGEASLYPAEPTPVAEPARNAGEVDRG